MTDLLSRDIDILSMLISEYISTAAPVGSGTIAKHGNFGLSPATIRSVMARLEETGLLTHPHTSAGRVPTAAGLRFYVNTLITKREPSEDEQVVIKKQFKQSTTSVEDIFRRAGKILSLVSNYTGLVVMPRSESITFKHMEFLPLSQGKVLGIFVSREGIVHNRVIDVGEELSYPELEKISNFCDSSYYGCTLEDALKKASKELEKERARYDKLIGKALLWSKGLFNDAAEDELLVQGETKLLAVPEFADVNKLKKVMDALEERKKIVHLLNRSVEGDEVSVYIGNESGVEAVSSCSIVTTPYKKGNKIIGRLGVIGPTRMNYSHVIPTVDFTAKILGEMLKD